MRGGQEGTCFAKRCQLVWKECAPEPPSAHSLKRLPVALQSLLLLSREEALQNWINYHFAVNEIKGSTVNWRLHQELD